MFSGETILERLNSDEYILRSTLIFENEKYKVIVTDGLKTDGASIPPLFAFLIGSPLLGKYVGSAIIHDGLYASHKLSKEEADLLFLEMLKDNDVSLWKRKAMYIAVKYFGKSAYYGKSQSYIDEMSKFVIVESKQSL